MRTGRGRAVSIGHCKQAHFALCLQTAGVNSMGFQLRRSSLRCRSVTRLSQALLLLALFLLGVASRGRSSGGSDAILAVELPRSDSDAGSVLSMDLPHSDSSSVSSSAAAQERSADHGAAGSSLERAADDGLSVSTASSSGGETASSESAWPVDEDTELFGPDRPSGGSDYGRPSTSGIAGSSGNAG